ncbi:MAG: hypothetical protein HYU75_03705 [Betaproteobacteria bacterium]|nr:hypothetical protein [Betaproteobacteria bacterium]
MAATILNTARASEFSVYVVRAFVRMREIASTHKALAAKLEALEGRLEQRLDAHDEAIAEILQVIRELMAPPQPKRRPIGFVTPEDKQRS